MKTSICVLLLVLFIVGCATQEKEDRGVVISGTLGESRVYSDTANKEEDTSLMHPFTAAVLAGDFKRAESMLKSHPKYLNIPDAGYTTPLHYAAMMGKTDAVRFLLEHKAEPDSKNMANYTPLHYAAENGHTEIIKLLVKNGADIDAGGKHIGATPLELAVDKNHVETAKALAEMGADIHHVSMRFTPIINAIRNGNLDMVKALLEKASPNPKVYKQFKAGGSTPLYWAAMNNRLDLVKLLIEKGADVNMGNSEGFTPLHWAVERDSIPVATVLLEHKADPNAKYGSGQTPISIAKSDEMRALLHTYGGQ